jgi:hypothetical protein
MCSRRSYVAVCAYAVLAAVPLLNSGCGGVGDDDLAAPPPPPCRAGAVSPIDDRTLLKAFAAEGIVLYRDDRCHSLPGTVISLTNIGSSDDYDSITGKEGHILCELFGEDLRVKRRIRRFVWLNDPTPTHIDVLNVSCGVFTDETAHTDAVERAFRRLPGVSRMPTTVPSADAVRD